MHVGTVNRIKLLINYTPTHLLNPDLTPTNYNLICTKISRKKKDTLIQENIKFLPSIIPTGETLDDVTEFKQQRHNTENMAILWP
jgi:hypothetical protein